MLKINKAYFYYGTILFLLVWLFFISPYKSKMANPDILQNEYLFVSIKFYAFLIWSILFLFFFRFIEKKYNDLFYPFILWNIMFFTISLNFNLGFDLTDEGWQLAKAWGIYNENFSNNADMIWGSSFIVGLWLKIVNVPLLIWSKLGYLLFLPFIGVVIYLIMVENISKRIAFISVVTAFFLFNKHFLIYPVINYYYLPVFTSLISFLFLFKFYRSEAFPVKFLVLSGLFAGISINLKFTYILFIPIFFIFCFFFYEKKIKVLKSILIFNCSLLCIVLLGFLILEMFSGLGYESNRLSVLNMFKTLFSDYQVNSSMNYSAASLMNLYTTDFILILKECIPPLLVFFTGSFLAFTYPKLRYMIIICIGVFLYLYFHINPAESHTKIYAVVFSASLLVLIFSNKEKNGFIFVNFIFLSVLILSFLGSGLSFYSGLISLGFFGFTSLLLALTYTCQTKVIDTRILFYSIMILVLSSQFAPSHSPYRDLPTKYLNKMFKSPELFGVYSFKERVDVVDDFISFSGKNFKKDDRIIFVGMPMLYYILDVKPVISETHDLTLNFEQLRNETVMSNPNVIVFPVQSPRGQLWPLQRNMDFWATDGFEKRIKHYYEFYNDYINDNNLKNVFENKMFIVFRKE